jgi:thymidylate synthase
MKAYLELLDFVRNHGAGHADRTGVGTVSRFGYQFRHDMALGFPLLTTKRVPPRWVFEEWKWMLHGHTDERVLRAEGVDIWQEWATKDQCARFGRVEGDLGPVYGWQLRHFGAEYVPLNWSTPEERAAYIGNKGYDQVWHLLGGLRREPYSRRHVVSMWHPAQANEVALPPCHTLFQVKVEHPIYRAHAPETEEDKPTLHLELYARSIDAFLGLPFNIASYGLWLSMLAHVCDFHRGELVISFGDLHIYRNHRTQVREQLGRQPKPLPTLRISDRLRGQGFDGLMWAKWGDIEVIGYDPLPSIPAPVAV